MMRATRRRREHGISLVEVMVALTILATVLISLGGLMYQVASQTRRSAMVTHRSAALQSSEAWLQKLPWDSIPSAVGCVADSSGIFLYNRCVTYSVPTTGRRRIRIVIAPTGAFVTRPETLVVDRIRPRLLSTLRVP